MVVVDVEALTPRQRGVFEQHRAHDFHSYFEAIRALSPIVPSCTDLSDPVATLQHRPRSSPDKALTAFCQLSALRLDTRRSMLFFFDEDNAYVLAEATRTLSLIDEAKFEGEDQLWLGNTIIPRGFSVCEHTVNIPFANAGSNSGSADAGVVHVINDLKMHQTFCDRPYVTDGPKARFYAGVPITTPRGNRIGALCVLDDKPRQGLDKKSVRFLTDMAATVMSHLDMVREKLQHSRGIEMIRGLGSFMDRAAIRRQSLPPLSEDQSDDALTPSMEMPSPWADHVQAPITIEPETIEPEPMSLLHNRARLVSPPPEPEMHENPLNPFSHDTRHAPEATPSRNHSRKKSMHATGMSLEDRVKETFQRAARIVQDCTAVDGVAFLDAIAASSTATSSRGGSTTSLQIAEQAPSTTTSEMSDDGEDCSPRPERKYGNPCAVLGAYSNTKSMSVDQPYTRVSEKLLTRLLKKYPGGKIWTFADNLTPPPSSRASSEPSSNSSSEKDQEQTTDGEPDRPSRAESLRHHKGTNRNDNEEIRRIFPAARSVALVGIWDPSGNRWYAGTLMWTASKSRVLSQEGEIHYVTAFCDVVMAEISRIDAQHSEQIKSDFISTISHELRSPLHGILGTAECLEDVQLDQPVSAMVKQIETCGRTLLDVIEHLLDFSKVVQYSRDSKRVRGSNLRKRRGHRDTSRAVTSSPASRRFREPTSLEDRVDLDRITEEIIDTTVYSYSYSGNKDMFENQRVAVTLDIDRQPGIDWGCDISQGAWKRVCMNVVNNALKYTSHGFVAVSLRWSASVKGINRKKTRTATLTVQDSGCGMSEQFLRNHLFREFTQEDPIVDGTGLGMSVVARIVKSLNGKVRVQSERGVGTTVEVSVPLLGTKTDGSQSSNSQSKELPHQGITVGFLGDLQQDNQDNRSFSSQRVFETVRRNCEALGMTANSSGWSAGPNTVNMILENDVSDLLREAKGPVSEKQDGNGCLLLDTPLIVVCNSALSLHRFWSSPLRQVMRGHVEVVSQPCGPEKLDRSVQACREPQGTQPTPSQNKQPTRPKFQLLPTITTTDITPDHRNWTSAEGMSSPPSTPVNESGPPERGRSAFLSPRISSRVLPDNQSPSPKSKKPTITSSVMERSRSSSSSSSAPAAHTTMLLVDDNAINLRILTAYSQKMKHSNLTAVNGADAVEKYIEAAESQMAAAENSTADGRSSSGAQKPQVIIMDVNMPVMDGFEAARRIRAYEKRQKQRWRSSVAAGAMQPATIIALTGLSSTDDNRQKSIACGMDLFLTKPVRLKELTAVLEEARQLRG